MALLLELLFLCPDLSRLLRIPSFSGDKGRQGGMTGAEIVKFNKGSAYCCDMIRGSDMGSNGVGVDAQPASELLLLSIGRCLTKSTTTSPCFAKSTTTSPCRAARSASSLSSSM